MGGGLPEGTQIVPGAMPEGSALFYLGSTLHGAGQHDGSAPPRDGLVFRQAFGLAQDAPSRRVHDTSHRLIFIYYLGWLNNLINFHFGAPPASQSSLGEGGGSPSPRFAREQASRTRSKRRCRPNCRTCLGPPLTVRQPPPPPPRRGFGDLGAAPRRVCRSGTDYDHPWIKGPLYTLPYQGGPGTLSSLTNADRAGAVR